MLGENPKKLIKNKIKIKNIIIEKFGGNQNGKG